jgi:lysophospholipase L1-like esterase
MRALILLVSLALAAACGRYQGRTFVPASDRRIVYTGRFEEHAGGARRFAWPASRIVLRFTGGTLRMRLTDTPVEDETRETDWVSIRIDDDPPRVVHLSEGTHEYTLAEDLPVGVHRVEIVKRTEAEVGTVILHGFELERPRTLERPGKTPRRHIELIGDSITAGYGNEAPNADCHWVAALQNSDRTYGAVAARELDASFSLVAWSGKGLLRNFDPRETETVPMLYERVIPTDPRSAIAPAVPNTEAVVINLGTNDFFASIPDEQAFLGAYRDLIAKVRRRYPDAVLFLAVGPMLADDFPHPQSRSTLRRWLTLLQGELHARGDRAVELIDLWIDPAEGLGCDSHPNVKTHARLGRELAEAIRKHGGW